MTSMAHRLHRTRAGLVATLAASILVVPDAASAHGIGGATDLPIPGWLFAWGATAVLILSFVALGVLWPKPRLESMGSRPALTLPRFAEPAAVSLARSLARGSLRPIGQSADSSANLHSSPEEPRPT